ncbi:MAG TPA: hypothetical protein VFW66_12265 [Gemmatimonadales bacterium]|nr:hypothetical protein [Gemmatimonadales bacterium]
MSKHSSKTTTDHQEIRRWAEQRDAQPACVKGTGGGDPGMIRLDFPGYTGRDELDHISWDEWFEQFDDNNLALVYQDTTAEGEQSNFNKLIGRETAKKRAAGKSHASRHASRRSSSQSSGHTSRKSSPTRRAASRSKSGGSSSRSRSGGSRSGGRKSGSKSRSGSSSRRKSSGGSRSRPKR